jgi:hypothetical protein
MMEVICYFASYFILHPGVFLQNHKLNKIWMQTKLKIKIKIFGLHKYTWT